MIKFESGIEIYHNTGDTLPTEGIPASSIALNMDDWTVSIYNGILWVPKGSKMVEIELVNGTFTFRYSSNSHAYACRDINIPLIEGKTYKVMFDGVEYETVCQNYNGAIYIGAVELLDYSLGAPSMPFVYVFMGIYMFSTLLADETHDIIIKTYEVQGV